MAVRQRQFLAKKRGFSTFRSLLSIPKPFDINWIEQKMASGSAKGEVLLQFVAFCCSSLGWRAIPRQGVGRNSKAADPIRPHNTRTFIQLQEINSYDFRVAILTQSAAMS